MMPEVTSEAKKAAVEVCNFFTLNRMYMVKELPMSPTIIMIIVAVAAKFSNRLETGLKTFQV